MSLLRVEYSSALCMLWRPRRGSATAAGIQSRRDHQEHIRSVATRSRCRQHEQRCRHRHAQEQKVCLQISELL